MAHVRQSGPESGPGFQGKELKPFSCTNFTRFTLLARLLPEGAQASECGTYKTVRTTIWP